MAVLFRNMLKPGTCLMCPLKAGECDAYTAHVTGELHPGFDMSTGVLEGCEALVVKEVEASDVGKDNEGAYYVEVLEQ